MESRDLRCPPVTDEAVDRPPCEARSAGSPAGPHMRTVPPLPPRGLITRAGPFGSGGRHGPRESGPASSGSSGSFATASPFATFDSLAASVSVSEPAFASRLLDAFFAVDSAAPARAASGRGVPAEARRADSASSEGRDTRSVSAMCVIVTRSASAINAPSAIESIADDYPWLARDSAAILLNPGP